MVEKEKIIDVSFGEALSIIANTKKSSIEPRTKDIELNKDNVYNAPDREAIKPPDSTKDKS